MNIPFYPKYYLVFLLAEFENAPFVIKIAILFASFLAITFVLTLIHIIVLNLIYLSRDKIKEQFNTTYQDAIVSTITSSALLEEEDIKECLGHHRNPLRKKNKRLYTEELIEIIKQTKISKTVNQENLLVVINHFQLDTYWQHIILKGRLKKRKNALRNMDELEHLLSGSVLLKSAYHRNGDFRKQSRAALIEYDQNDPFKFFEESFDSDFNALDEIRLHHYLEKKSQTSGLPDFSRWVENAKNDHFKRFIIKEIGLLKQLNCANFLINLLQTEKQLVVRKQIVETLGVLDFKAADTPLISIYATAATGLQKKIIETLAILKTEKTLAFLVETYQYSHDSSMKIQLAHALNDYGVEGQEKFEALSLGDNHFNLEVFAQVNFSHNQKDTPYTALT
ncbi:hypothetical protein [Flavobacterium sp. JP2137]|uniref:HEAT repeat domain-containing protein n=1 Tax=Flavobacterium sp. JP2137 TaxID=3414510 RepID=UPI003D300A3E